MKFEPSQDLLINVPAYQLPHTLGRSSLHFLDRENVGVPERVTD